MKNSRESTNEKQGDVEFVREKIASIRFESEQHLLGEARELMEEYPSTIGKPIIEEALKHGGVVKVKVICLPSDRNIKPYLTEAGTIVVNR